VTPEGKVKAKVKAILGFFGVEYDMPVSSGFGKQQLDFCPVSVNGHLLLIETKAPGEKLTPLQRVTAMRWLKTGASVFIISNNDGLDALERYLRRTLGR
jgi:hypothetical protein